MYITRKLVIATLVLLITLTVLSANEGTPVPYSETPYTGEITTPESTFKRVNPFGDIARRTAFAPDAGNTTSFFVDGLPVEAAYTDTAVIIRYLKSEDEIDMALEHIMLAIGADELEELGTPGQGIARIPYPTGMDKKSAEDTIWALALSGEFGY